MAIDTRHPREIRADIRNGKITGVTAGLGAGHVQANLAVLPRDYAYDFLLFCQRNPRPCPLIEVTDVGSSEPVGVAPGADLRTDIPRYRIYKDGVLADEVTDATPYWRDDLVAFLLGCSFTFEWALLEAGIKLWHVDNDKNVAMWKTSIECRPAGVFHGPMVVSMRPIPSSQLSKAVTASARFPNAHGAPVHIGDPSALGIKDIARPDWGDAQAFKPGDVPVFWACGVTPQAQKTGTSPGAKCGASPQSGRVTSATPIAEGSPMWTGAPWALGNRALAVTAFASCAAAIGRIETTIGPWKTPAGRHWVDVRHIATFLPCSTCQSRMPASSSAHSKVKEHPSRNATRSSRQYGVASVTSSVSTPSL